MTPLALCLTVAVAQAQIVPQEGAFWLAPPLSTTGIADNVFRPVVSGDGRWIAFHTDSASLDPGDDNGQSDIYLLNRDTRLIERISAATDGGAGDEASVGPALSRTAQLVAFHSGATNLVSGDGNGQSDVFVFDRQSGITRRASLGPAGAEGNAPSINAAISGDGRFVAFSSRADNLVPQDSNGLSDVFVHDRLLGRTDRVSVASSGAEGDGGSFSPSLSASGRYVAFTSEATNFSDNEFDVLPDLFVHDRATGQTELVNVSTAEIRANADSARPILSPDGSAVAFYSRATTLEPGTENIFFDIFLRDLLAGTTVLVSQGPQGASATANSFNPVLSVRGRYVAFQSESPLASGDDNLMSDIWVRDTITGALSLASRRPPGSSGNGGSFTPSISYAGDLVGFESTATDLDGPGGQVAGFAWQQDAPRVTRIATETPVLLPPPIDLDFAASSPDGLRFLVASASAGLIEGDDNGLLDLYLVEPRAGSVRLVSRGETGGVISGASAGNSSAGAMSDNGCLVAFASEADGDALGNGPAITDDNGLSDIYLRQDCPPAPLKVVSLAMDGTRQGSGASFGPALSAAGDQVAFVSEADNLVADPVPQGISQIYHHDVQAGVTALVSRTTAGAGGQPSDQVSISADGRFIVFVGRDPGLDPSLDAMLRPPPGQPQVYRHDRETGESRLISMGVTGGQAQAPDGPSDSPAVSADGSIVVFASQASNLVAPPATGIAQVYLWEAAAAGNGLSLVAPSGVNLNGASGDPRIARDGRLIMLASDASNWIPGDDNATTDVFVVDRLAQTVFLASRQGDASPLPGGATRPVAVSGSGNLTLSFLVPQGTEMHLRSQPALDTTPRLAIDAVVPSPLQSVEAATIALQVRNAGGGTLRQGDQLAFSFPQAQNGYAVTGIDGGERWQCQPAPAVDCVFTGDPVVGDALPPAAADPILVQFQMAAGTQPVTGQAQAMLHGVLAATADLVTQRVQSGVVWSAVADESLPAGTAGAVQIEVVNGGQVNVQDITLLIQPLAFGAPWHPPPPGATGNWQCQASTTEAGMPASACVYTGPPLQPNVTDTLSYGFELNFGSRLTVVTLSGDMSVITPAAQQLMQSRVADLVFGGGFEG